ncbi:MAG: IS1 family transposase [Gloeomargaritaceae cyanobacterium C42_A2020_066]|nr:IS1 family transposase [Gloeomargaritaceae cyanobacterium C42_A2020_066]
MTLHDDNPRPPCPRCHSTYILKNGSTHHKKQKYLCKNCHYQFIDSPSKKYITPSETQLIHSCLLERISLAGISRITNISLTSVHRIVKSFLRQVPCHIEAQDTSDGDFNLECDELWSFVKSKLNPVWIWVALERSSRKIVGLHFGSRGRDSTQAFWDSLPSEIRDCATVYTDLWKSYIGVIPEEAHQRSRKGSGQTSLVERFNNTIRQRCSRLVRGSLSISRRWFNHERLIWHFVHNYNASLDSA